MKKICLIILVCMVTLITAGAGCVTYEISNDAAGTYVDVGRVVHFTNNCSYRVEVTYKIYTGGEWKERAVRLGPNEKVYNNDAGTKEVRNVESKAY